MPRYFFHRFYESGAAIDRSERELRSDEAAISDAFLEAKHVRGFVVLGQRVGSIRKRLEVRDNEGKLLATVGVSPPTKP